MAKITFLKPYVLKHKDSNGEGGSIFKHFEIDLPGDKFKQFKNVFEMGEYETRLFENATNITSQEMLTGTKKVIEDKARRGYMLPKLIIPTFEFEFRVSFHELVSRERRLER